MGVYLFHPIFDATGSKLFSSRWNTADRPIVYTSEHCATAMLEILAGAGDDMPPNQHYIEITLLNGLSYEVLNPAHPEFLRITVGPHRPIWWDKPVFGGG